MKNLVENAFGDLVERTDYGNHKNQLNLFDNLNEIVEENRTALYWGLKTKGRLGITKEEFFNKVKGELG